ncbi:energy transducer TonB family protein [Psychrobacter sp. AOP22-C1-C5]|uniref:energy transducer TonB family protein n=1 Tax=Psychrobacter sp. AOP22-C1-C5 TaxID=3457716 RepID=UPI0040357E8B
MTSKLHTKHIFNTLHKFIKYSKNITRHSLLAVSFAFLTCIASTMTAQAELIDLSDSEPVIQLSTQDANWLIKPNFRINERCLRHLNNRTELNALLSFMTDEQGKIISAEVIKSSGDACIDEMALKQIRRGQLKPLTFKGDKVKIRVTLPLKFVIRDWED